VVRLQYHLHIPDPDPLANPMAEARAKYYGAQIRGTPVSLFNGKSEAAGGGRDPAEAESKFIQYKKVIDALLETPAKVKLQLAVQRDGDKIAVNAKVSDLARPDDRTRLRVMLAEELVRYQGGNGLRYHHHVVRSFVGRPDGVPLKTPTYDLKATASVD